MLTLDDNYSRQKIRSDNFGYGIWFNQGSLRNVDLDENGTVLDFTQDGSQTDFTAGTDRSYLETNQTGLNLKWDATANLKIEADASYAKSWLNPDGQLTSDNRSEENTSELQSLMRNSYAVVGLKKKTHTYKYVGD